MSTTLWRSRHDCHDSEEMCIVYQQKKKERDGKHFCIISREKHHGNIKVKMMMKLTRPLVLTLGFVGMGSTFVPLPSPHNRQAMMKTAISLQYDSTGGAMLPGVDEKTDMNQYNLDYESSVEEWTANVLPKTLLQEEGIYLGVKDKKNLFVDTLTFVVSRNGGLGLELLEIAGGREDGVGITIVSGLVAGGNSIDSGILPGDSIVSIQVEGKDNDTTASTECLGYDLTIDSILSLPPDGEKVIIKVKRVRRKPKVDVVLQYPPDSGEEDQYLELFAGENLRRAMLVRGVRLNDALALRFDSGGTGDCGSEGTCATCVVGIMQGGHLMNPMGIQEEQILVNNPRWRMACKTLVGYGAREGKMIIRVNPRQWNDR